MYVYFRLTTLQLQVEIIVTMADTLISDYEASLRELTINSKPIIDNLTIIARENTAQAEGITGVIINRIYKCIPEQKLYSLYLLDSICKAVGAPYNLLFGQEIFKIFSHIYVLVNEATRAKLVKIYELWKTTKAKGTNDSLFPDTQLEKIGTFLRQALPRKIEDQQQKSISQSNLVADLDSLVSILQQNGATDPSDSLTSQKLSALGALRQYILLQPLSQSDLRDVQEKLTQMRNQAQQKPKIESPHQQNVPLHHLPKNSVAGIVAPTNSTPEADPPKPKAVSLFQTLVASGLIKVDQSLKAGSKPEYELVLPKHKFIPQTYNGSGASFLSSFLQNAHLSQMPQHEQIKYKEIIKIEKKLGSDENRANVLQQFIIKNVLDASTVQVLYETKSLKCSQCGKRFPVDDNGAIQKRLHLDWHFRINKRQANYKTNVQSRSWYLDTSSWTQFQENELSELEPSVTKKEITPANMAPQQTYVVIPSDETNMNNVCAICREHIKPSINPSTEEWVWSGCMLAPGNNSGRKIVHIACYEEAKKKRGAEDDGGSRVKRERHN